MSRGDEFDIEFEVPILGTDDSADVHCTFQVTSWGSPDSWMEPGDPIEWEVDRIWVDEEEILYHKDEFEGALWQVLATACDTYIGDNFDFGGNYPEPEPDYDHSY